MCMFHKKKDKTPAAFSLESTEMTALPPEEDRRFILEQQIHGQFSENSNEHVSSFVTFVVSLLALFGAFGYVYANTVDVFKMGFGYWPELTPSASETLSRHGFTMDSFLWLSVIVSIMLCFIACLCIFLGYAERRDQVQQWLVRRKNGLDTAYSDPTNRCWCNYLNEYYRMFYHLLIVLQVLVMIVCIFRVLPFFQLYCANPDCVVLIAFTLVIQVVCVAACLFTKYHYFQKYKETVGRCNKYLKKAGVVLKDNA